MKNALKTIFWLFIFIVINCIFHILLTSVVTFFHFQLNHRLVDIQDWINVNNWSLYFIRVTLSFYCFEKLFNVFYFKRNLFKAFKSELLEDINIKNVFILASAVLIALVITFVPIRNENLPEVTYALFVSYLGQVFFLTVITWVFIIIKDCINVEKTLQGFTAIIYVLSFYLVEAFFLKQTLVKQSGSFALLFLAIYIAAIKEKSSFKTSLFITIFALAPFVSLCGLDIMHGERYSPYVLTTSFTWKSVLNLSVIVGLIFWFQSRKKRPAIN